jgi:hypothetical protein
MAKAEKAQHGTTYEIPDTPECRAMENLLGKTLKCTLDDGRTATGDLVCIDRLYVLLWYIFIHALLILKLTILDYQKEYHFKRRGRRTMGRFYRLQQNKWQCSCGQTKPQSSHDSWKTFSQG